MFLLNASADSHLGRVCTFKQCPKESKLDCLVARCGEHRFLKQVKDFTWQAGNLAAGRHVMLYDGRTDPPILPDPSVLDAEARQRDGGDRYATPQ